MERSLKTSCESIYRKNIIMLSKLREGYTTQLKNNIKMEKVLNLSLTKWQRVALSLLFVLLSMNVSAQLGGVIGNLMSSAKPQVVTDPTAHAKAAATITQIKGVIGGINRQIEHLQEAANKLRQVSSTVSTMQMVDEIMRLREQFYDESQLCLNRLEAAKTHVDMDYYRVSLLAIYGTTRRLETDLQIIDIVLTGGLVSMEDADRIDQLQKIKVSILEGITDVRIMRSQVENKVGYAYFERLYLSDKNTPWK